MFLREKIIALPDHQFLILTLFNAAMKNAFIARDISNTGYAKIYDAKYKLTRADIAHLAFMDLPPDSSEAQYYHNLAAQQRSIINQDRYLWYAGLWEMNARLYPEQALFSKKGIGLLSFNPNYIHESNKRIPPLTALINLFNDSIFLSSGHITWKAINDQGTLALRTEVTPIFSLFARNESCIYHSVTGIPQQRLEMISLKNGTVIDYLPHPINCKYYGFWRNQWVFILSDAIELYDLEGNQTTRIIFKSPGPICDFSIHSSSALCALGLVGGRVLLLNLITGTIQVLHPHPKINRPAFTRVKIHETGTLVASACEDEMVITNLIYNPPVQSVPIRLTTLSKAFKNPQRQYTAYKTLAADFEFWNDKILVLSNGKLSEYECPLFSE